MMRQWCPGVGETGSDQREPSYLAHVLPMTRLGVHSTWEARGGGGHAACSPETTTRLAHESLFSDTAGLGEVKVRWEGQKLSRASKSRKKGSSLLEGSLLVLSSGLTGAQS